MENKDNIRILSATSPKKSGKIQPKRDISGYCHDDEPFNPVRSEMAMWRAVITQALMDAASNSHKSEAKYHKREAIAWLLHAGEDFNTVCEYAGLEPDYVRSMAKSALQRGCQWRAPSAGKPRLPAIRPLMEFKSLTIPAPVAVPAIFIAPACA